MTQIYTYQSQLVRELRTVPNHKGKRPVLSGRFCL